MSISSDFIGALAGIADALTWGSLSNITVAELQHKYSLEAAEINQMINVVQRTIAQDQDALDKLRERKADIHELARYYPQLELLLDHYLARRGVTDDDIAKAEAKVKAGEKQLSDLNQRMFENSLKQGEMNAGTVAKKLAEGKEV
jgi:hypothetical protein